MDIFRADTSDPLAAAVCLKASSKFFVQYKCEQDYANVNTKQQNSIFIIIIEIVCSGFVLFTVWFNFFKTKKMDAQYSQYTINANDFALYVKISPEKLYQYNTQFNDMQNG